MAITRRDLLGTTTAGILMGSMLAQESAAMTPTITAKPAMPRMCLNTSTIREAKIPLNKLVDMVADAGYQGIEPWIREIDTFVEAGGKLSEVKKQIKDRGMTMESAIGFPAWAVDDESKRTQGIEEAKRCMDLVLQLGCVKIAAPPIGVHAADAPLIPLDVLAERYAKLLELGDKMGVCPQLEIWGPSKNLSRVSEAMYVASATGNPNARLLLDAYHIFRGGSSFEALRMIAGQSMELFHINDYPATPERVQQTDAMRVYPGDGVAPLVATITEMLRNGYQGAFSLELFNKEYYKQDPVLVLKTGVEKIRAVLDAVMVKLS
jgi:sugar phosphate isomerase/epimerase